MTATAAPPTRAARRAAKRAEKQRQMRLNPGTFRSRIENFTPPEGVPISFQVASLGSRFGAQFLDVLITILTVIAVLWLFGIVIALPWTAWVSLFVLLTFLARIPYYVLAELVWNGRTLGKRMVGIRVISADGRRLTPHQIAARNLLKEVEFFTPLTFLFGLGSLGFWPGLLLVIWLIVIILVPSFNRKRQRIGDIIAGTYVIETPKPALLGDLATARAATEQKFAFLPVHLEHYGRYELQTLESILRHHKGSRADHEAVEKIVAAIVHKIGYPDRIAGNDRLAFLFAFYRAQREYLENRKLFGDAREDKFHKTDPAPPK